MSLIVTLTPEQVRWALAIGTRRAKESKHGTPAFAYGQGEDALLRHRQGALGELAGAVALKLEWPARVNTFRIKPDIDPFWEARWTGWPKKVKVAHDDKPDQLVLHVTGRSPTFEVHGFILAGWAQENVPLTDPGDRKKPAHFVDPSKLTPIDENFHTTCAWFLHPERGWICVYCGRIYDGPLPEQLAVVRPNTIGRPEG